MDLVISTIAQGLLWALLAIGVYLTFRVLDIADLTVEGSFPLGAAVAATMLIAGYHPVAAILGACVAGMLSGVVTGFLCTKLKIPALLAGILTMIALYSVNLRIMGKANVSLLRMPTVFDGFGALGLSRNLSMVAVGLLFVLAVLGFVYWFFGTEIGCAVRATGDNARMARAQGVNTDAMKILGLVLSNGLVALSGGLIAQSQTFADIQMGTGSIVIGLASLIIGEVLFGKKTFSQSLRSLVFGAICYRLIIALVLKLGMPANDLKLFTALTVAVALSLPTLKQKAQARKAAREEARQCSK